MISRRRSASSFEQNRVSDALILMAGSGSRLRGADDTFLKPLVSVLGRPLISYTIGALSRARIRKIHAVVGFEGERLGVAVKGLIPSGIEFRLIENPEWQKQNGISVLAASECVTAPFLLAMSDHVFDDTTVELLTASADLNQLNLAVDKKLNSIFDLSDAMKVQTRGGRVVAIGKNLRDYDAVDTGLFVCPSEIFRYLERAKQNGDCSLADGVRLMAADGKVRAVDIGSGWWQDVDTPEMLQHATKAILKGAQFSVLLD